MNRWYLTLAAGLVGVGLTVGGAWAGHGSGGHGGGHGGHGGSHGGSVRQSGGHHSIGSGSGSRHSGSGRFSQGGQHNGGRQIGHTGHKSAGHKSAGHQGHAGKGQKGHASHAHQHTGKGHAKGNHKGHGGHRRPLSQRDRRTIRDMAGRFTRDAVLHDALVALGGDGALTATQVEAVSDLIEDADSGLSATERGALVRGLQASGEEEAVATADAESTIQKVRYLKLKNDTEEKLAVYVQYRTQDDEGSWTWVPANPRRSAKAVRYDLDPGEETSLGVSADEKLSANVVRIWAVSRGGDEWDEYKDEDLWLVDEKDDDGKLGYEAEEVETYVYTFAP